jgi:hypothetical protein
MGLAHFFGWPGLKPQSSLSLPPKKLVLKTWVNMVIYLTFVKKLVLTDKIVLILYSMVYLFYKT